MSSSARSSLPSYTRAARANQQQQQQQQQGKRHYSGPNLATIPASASASSPYYAASSHAAATAVPRGRRGVSATMIPIHSSSFRPSAVKLLAISNPNIQPFYDYDQYAKDFDTRPRPTHFVSWPAREV
ncbi:hypothetical protein DHEL01_v207944 [Diaporthe helianthi]|uniref:Uncharacterized protein n=1 Tax=Diaporthe helianthi TaxID=158607 RepID=A0A2P5HTT3_DIAHE|nr:hypothetical protein DHEL01_v207944 [Diaporthe helianthi]